MPARGSVAVGAGVVLRQDLRGHAGGIAAGRPGEREGLLRNDQGRQAGAQARNPEAAGGKNRRREAGRRDCAQADREKRAKGQAEKHPEPQPPPKPPPNPGKPKKKEKKKTQTQARAAAAAAEEAGSK